MYIRTKPTALNYYDYKYYENINNSKILVQNLNQINSVMRHKYYLMSYIAKNKNNKTYLLQAFPNFLYFFTQHE